MEVHLFDIYDPRSTGIMLVSGERLELEAEELCKYLLLLGKFGAIFASIPASIMTAIYCIFFRTNFIFELVKKMGQFNDTVYAIFMSHATIASVVAVFLFQTLLFSNDEARKHNGSHWRDKVNLVTPFRHRHAIHTQTQRYLSLDLSELKVRSILLLDKEFKHLDDKKFIKLCTTFLHLYVLDLENIYIVGAKLPDAIGNLVHLKFLGLSNTNLFELPSSIGKLKNLQTLDALIDDRCSCKLPSQITQLTNLRHLITRYEVPLQVDRLTNLRTLKYICCNQWKHTDASRLVNLQELGMEKIMKSYSLKSIGSLKSLTTLFLVCSYGETFPPLEPLSSCENLQRLWLSGRIEEVAIVNNLPKSITVLVLQSTVLFTGLEEDPMPILGKLPNLKHLELSRAYNGKKITCNGNSFGQLETLRLGDLKNLESWHIHTTAMSVLKSLTIFECPELKKIPERLEHIAVLDGPLTMKLVKAMAHIDGTSLCYILKMFEVMSSINYHAIT
ncbi:hypothetical protein H5410_024237 [Solanum commersonii]|uniref:Disease resistance R13L4/SHOC-2-like LRR domain-containing protein n=1 Tax=Solanum commersonii TaxID=4109 RepID=A0A9J5ZLF4_SOLCO|nr:hypothetical protein H5410_024237 [Solanum commersonii]